MPSAHLLCTHTGLQQRGGGREGERGEGGGRGGRGEGRGGERGKESKTQYRVSRVSPCVFVLIAICD